MDQDEDTENLRAALRAADHVRTCAWELLTRMLDLDDPMDPELAPAESALREALNRYAAARGRTGTGRPGKGVA